MVIESKKAWIRIVEAFVAILLVMGVLLIVINQGYLEKEDISAKVYRAELAILREVQLNDTLRDDILNIATFPVEWEDFDSKGLGNLKNKIISRLPNYLDCEAKICELNETCVLNKTFDKDIYAQSVSITTTLAEYNPRQLKLFCWVGLPGEVEEEPEEPEEPTCAELCMTNPCETYDDPCSSSEGTCDAGEYCCEGACEVILPEAFLTLSFSDTVYSLVGVNHTYTHNRTFNESGGVGVTINRSRICYETPNMCVDSPLLDYRIDANDELIQTNRRAWTNESQNVFTAHYWGIDNNGNEVYVNQSMCVQGTQSYPNSIVCA